MSSTHSDHDEPETSRRAAQRRPRPASRRRQQQPPEEPLEPRVFPDPPPPPVFQWMRGRMQGFRGQINLYIRDDVVRSIPLVLRRVGGQRLVDRFTEGPFGYLLEIRRSGSANTALHELLARELEDESIPEMERWFHVGGKVIRFRAQEYAIVTGLAFGESPFNPKGRHNPPNRSLLYTKYGGKSPKINKLKADFNDDKSELGDADQYLKAANLLMYYLMLLGHDNPVIEDWAWQLVEYEEQWRAFPWGAWSFQIMLHVMKRDPAQITGVRPAYHLYGPVWALNIWAYEAIPRMGQACGVRDCPTLSPRLRRWATCSSSCNFVGFFDNHELDVHPTLEADEYDGFEYAFHSLESHEPIGVAYVPSKRHEQTNLPPERRVSKAKEKGKAKLDMASAVDKLKCKGASDAVAPRRRAPRAERAQSEGSKRPRSEHADPRPSGLICCAHGDPCERGPLDDDFLDRFGDRLVSRWEQDRSGTGFLGRLARAIAGELKKFMGKSPSRSRSSSGGEGQSRVGEQSFAGLRDVPVEPAEDYGLGDHGESPRRSEGRHSAGRRSAPHVSDHPESSRHSEGGHSVGQLDRPHSVDVVDLEESEKRLSAFAEEIEQMRGSSEDEESRVASTSTHPAPGGQTRASSREIRPSQAVRSPYVVEQPRTSKYERWKASGSPHVTVYGTQFYMTRELFLGIEDMTGEFDATVIDLYTVYWRNRLRQGLQLADGVTFENTIVMPLSFYVTLLDEYKKFHKPHDTTMGLTNLTLKYTRWKVPDEFLRAMEGHDTYRPWKTGHYFVVVCHLSSEHWVVCRVNVPMWRVEVYDSFYWKYENNIDPPLKKQRIVQLLPLTRLFTRILAKKPEYYTRVNPGLHNYGTQFMTLAFMPMSQQFVQVDEVSCGVYACMYLDTILGRRREYKGDTKQVLVQARAKIANRIFKLSRSE